VILNILTVETILAEQGLTKTELANRCGMSRQTVSTVLKRGTCEPRTAGRLAFALGVPVEQIIEEAK
jgi:DNA-binding Xre family transcriptional regulator